MKILLCLCPFLLFAGIQVGVGQADITPPVGTYSAGYMNRKEGMTGVHDPLMAIAMYIESGDQKIAFCSVDNLGFTYDMVQEIKRKVRDVTVFIGSTHTHSGGGGFLNIPGVEWLAGPFDSKIRQRYINGAVTAIEQAIQSAAPGKLGIGYGKAGDVSLYRSSCPESVEPLLDIAVIKATKLDGTPLGMLFNFPLHPTVMDGDNKLFSADFVGYTRAKLGVPTLYFNGAQGEIIPKVKSRTWEECERIGSMLADAVMSVEVELKEEIAIATDHLDYSFKPEKLPVPLYLSEMNVIVFDGKHTFLTIPGELSCVYDHRLKGVSILGLTNDAHGYILTPEAIAHKTPESMLSFGGEMYGEKTMERAVNLLQKIRSICNGIKYEYIPEISVDPEATKVKSP